MRESQFFVYIQRIMIAVMFLFTVPVFADITYNPNNCIADINSDCDSTRRQCVAVSGKVFTGWYTADSGGTYIEDLTTYNGTAYAHCATGKFAIAIKTPANKQFVFTRAFSGTLNIDWGDGNTTTSTSTNMYDVSVGTHTYANANTVYVIVLTDASVTNYAGYSNYATIKFGTTPTAIINIYGSLGALFPTNTSLEDTRKSPRFVSSFANATNLVGPLPPNLFQGITVSVSSMFATTFNGCSALSGYLSPGIFDSSLTTSAQSYSNNMFNGTNLDTSCPANTYEVQTSIQKSWLNNKVACESCPLYATSPAGSTSANACACPTNSTLNGGGTECVCDSGYSWNAGYTECTGSSCPMYNGICAVACSDTDMNNLKTSTGSSIPIWGNKITTPSINIQHGNTTCYIPLATGNAPSNSLRINHNGTVYYAVTPQ